MRLADVAAVYLVYRPSLFGALVTLAGVALFIALGLWQLQRAEEKRTLLAQAAQGRQSTVEATVQSANAAPRYQRVRARGRYDSQHQVLLDHMPSPQGRAGYRVLTPLHLEQGGWLLVDRGWIEPGATREQLPQVAVDEAPRSIVARLDRLPEPGLRLGDSADLGESWPRVLSFPTHAQLERVLKRRLAQRIALLEPGEPDGFERSSQPLAHIAPGRHIAYAVQWFAFAALAVILYVVVNRKKTGPH